MSTRPNALVLAAKLRIEVDSTVGVVKYSTALQAAAELRAQHELIQTLTAALDKAFALSIGHAASYQIMHKLAGFHPTHQATIDAAQAALAAAEAHK